ncbi:MAG: hypothetical protein EOP10_19595 [Proteobacteria bacterium]|nr:MAG: hypothetical protein EOP10_19595 [Pseudomonadota bacterium]
MRGLLLAVGLILSGLSFAQGAGAPPPVPEAKPAAPTTFVAQGEAVEIPAEGFTIVPPVGWQVLKNNPGTTLLFQGPKIEPKPGETTYQPNIRIMSLDPEPMDDLSKDKYSKLILENSSKLGGISGYNLRSTDKVTLASGSLGYLYYTEFSLGAVPMMQMHVLTSSAKHSYLMTYTDLATAFEGENSPALATAYTAMQSVKLDSKPADRFAQYYVIGGIGVALLLLLIITRFVRSYSMKRLGDRIESEDGGETSARDDDDEVSGFAEIGSGSRRHRQDDEDEEEMPETREAQRPAAKAKSVPAPAPRAPAPAPAPTQKAAPAPLPKAAPVQKQASARAPIAPRSEFSEQSAKMERTTASNDRPDLPLDDGDPVSNYSEIKPKTVVTTKKAKPQKVQNPAKMKDIEADADEEGSDVARLSEILPNTGDTKKKKGFFGFGKSKSDDDDGNEKSARIGDEESWDNKSKKSSKKSKDDDEQPMSEVAGWNLKDGSSSKSGRSDDGDDD